MEIVIDSMEKDRKQRALDFYTTKGHDAKVERLDVGDYVFNDTVVWEYKEISDFISSIKNESVFNEASNQALQYPFHYLIIVGELKHYVTRNWKFAKQSDYPKYVHNLYSKYYGALRRLRTFTTTIEVDNEKQAFAEMLLQSKKCLDGKSKIYSNITRPVPSQDAVIYLLCGVNGVSIKKAEAIIKHHNINNLYDLMKLKVDDFKQVKGIGEKMSLNIYEFIHGGDE